MRAPGVQGTDEGTVPEEVKQEEGRGREGRGEEGEERMKNRGVKLMRGRGERRSMRMVKGGRKKGKDDEEEEGVE